MAVSVGADRMMTGDILKPILAGVGILGSRIVALQSGLTDDHLTDAQIQFFQWALREGGLFVVIVVILYFYRRDFRRTNADQQAQTNALLHVVQAATTAMQANKTATERLARAVESNQVKRHE